MAAASSEMVTGVVVDVAVEAAAEVRDGLDAMEHRGGQQEGKDGKRCDGDEEHIDGAGQVLAAAAVAQSERC